MRFQTNGFKACRGVSQLACETPSVKEPMVDVMFCSLIRESLRKTNGFKAIFPGETKKNPSVKEPMVDEQTVCLIGRRTQEMVRNGQ